MSEHLTKYIQYIKNTNRVPLPSYMFDEDWEPIGPKVRQQLADEGLISQGQPGDLIYLTQKGQAMLERPASSYVDLKDSSADDYDKLPW